MFQTVHSVHLSPASELALRLQRASYTAHPGERIRRLEQASIAREWMERVGDGEGRER